MSEEIVALRKDTDLLFSTVCLEPYLRLSGGLPDNAAAEIVLRVGPRLLPIGESISDSAIADSRWFPVDAAALTVLRELLHKHGIETSGSLTLGQYLAIGCDPEAIATTIDETPSGPIELDAAVASVQVGLAIDLFPYQKVGVAYLTAMAERDVGVLLADQMGLGKTVQAIGLLLNQRSRGMSLVVAPASLLVNWEREFHEIAPGLRVLLHAGPKRAGVVSGLSGHDVVITSYETVINDFSFMGDVEWNVAVLDEAQSVRNPDARRSGVMKALRRRVSIAMTGTPVENRLADLWSIGEFVIPALLGSRERFEIAFPDEVDRARLLGHVVAPVTLRRLVAEVAVDLPELLETQIALVLPSRIAARYDAVLLDAPSQFAATTELRVLCAHADNGAWDTTDEYPPKVSLTFSLLEEMFENGEKCLVFASFTATLDRLYDEAVDRHPNAFLGVVDGRVAGADRQSIIDSFSASSAPGVLFMNPKAAGSGLNIPAANHVVHFNPEWNPAVSSQATARAHRIGQTRPVTVHSLYYVGTVEEDAMVRADAKRQLAAGVDQGVGIGNGSP